MKTCWSCGWLFLTLLPIGCLPRQANEVIVYSALDKEFSEPILEAIATDLGISIRTKFDQESNKTVGLVTDLIQHQSRPRADIFWNNEILHTLRLKQLGLLDAYVCPSAAGFPAGFRDPDGTWTGFAARARVLVVNTDLIPAAADYPSSIEDLADSKWQGKCGIAKPLFGTSATHAAVLFNRLGDQQATDLFQRIADNAVVEGGNRQVAIKVGRGELVFGLTDTDDAMLEIDRASPVVIVYPDQGPDQPGTLLIPNTICLIRNGPNNQQARRVIERLLQPDIESELAMASCAQFPLNPKVTVKSRAASSQPMKVMEADFEGAAAQWEKSAAKLVEIFEH